MVLGVLNVSSNLRTPPKMWRFTLRQNGDQEVKGKSLIFTILKIMQAESRFYSLI